jgi:hypothetical protein
MKLTGFLLHKLGVYRAIGKSAPEGRIPSPGEKVAERQRGRMWNGEKFKFGKSLKKEKNHAFSPAFLISHRHTAATASPRGKLQRLRRRVLSNCSIN